MRSILQGFRAFLRGFLFGFVRAVAGMVAIAAAVVVVYGPLYAIDDAYPTWLRLLVALYTGGATMGVICGVSEASKEMGANR